MQLTSRVPGDVYLVNRFLLVRLNVAIGIPILISIR